MSIHPVNNVYYIQNNAVLSAKAETEQKPSFSSSINNNVNSDSISFKRAPDITKRLWLMFRKLSNYMKEPSEMTNAAIAAIGTGAIAPFAIMCSPKPKKKTEEVIDEKAARDKKKFQALRQPVSAGLAFGFQVPTTIGIAALFNNGAYEKHWNVFKDKDLDTLIPDEKYLAKKAERALKNSSNESIKNEWKEEFLAIADEAKMKAELIEQLKEDYNEVEISVSQEKLEKLANQPRRKRKFLSKKMAKLRHDRYIDEKVQSLLGKNIEIKDFDLVTESYKDGARNRYKAEFDALRANANLSPLDNFIEAMGFSNKKLKALDEAQKALAKERGLEIMKKEEPKVFSGDKVARLKKYVENCDVKAKKLYSNKIFWFTLGTNLIMVAISCIALNWLHPKFAKFVENIQQKKSAQDQDKKVEVRA